MPDFIRVSDLLAGLREKAGMTRAEVARRMIVSESTVARLEKARDASVYRVMEYCMACGAKLSITERES